MPEDQFDSADSLYSLYQRGMALLESGVFMVPIVYPGCKEGEERLRLNVTRGHTREDMDRTLDLLDTYGKVFYVQAGEELGPMEQWAE